LHSLLDPNPLMPTATLSPAELRLTIDPDSLGFADTSELMQEPLPWIGQARAEAAARFGLGMDQLNYNLLAAQTGDVRGGGQQARAPRPVLSAQL
jgi:hypothetical protein